MNQLTPTECRVLGVLIEKAQTTPAQYPLTLNALVSGCSQKNNREPVCTFSEDEVLEALDGLRAKSYVREVLLSGSRVEKYRHVARETLDIGTSELVVLAELLLRGPQTLGEIRGRASRMHPIESLDILQNIIDHLMQRDPPLVRAIAPAPGSRAGRFAQLLCPDLHPLDAPAAAAPASASGRASGPPPVDPDRLAALEAEVARLRAAIETIASSLGIDDLTTGA